MTGKEIKGLRGRLGLTQVDMGRLFNVQGLTVCRWETSRSKPWGTATLLLTAMCDRIQKCGLSEKVGTEIRSALEAGPARAGFVILMYALFGDRE